MEAGPGGRLVLQRVPEAEGDEEGVLGIAGEDQHRAAGMGQLQALLGVEVSHGA